MIFSCLLEGWLRGTVVERRSLTDELSLFYAWPAADGDHLCGWTVRYKVSQL